MKKILLMAAAIMVVAVPALAGGGAKCSASAQACLNQHSAAAKTKAWVGLEYDKTEAGATVVKKVHPDSPAAAAGFEPGDVLVAMNGAKMGDKEAMKKAKGEWKAGQTVTYTVMRKDAEKQIAVTLGTMPEQAFAAMVGQHMLESHVTAATTAAASEAKSEAKSNK